MSTKIDLQADELEVGGVEILETGDTFEETTKVVTQNGTEVPKQQPVSNLKFQLSEAIATDDENTTKVSLKTILQSLTNRIKSLLNRFDAVSGHSHTGIDSKKISYSDIDNKPDLTLKADLVDGLVPASQLPRYLDNIDELLTFSDTAPTTGLTDDCKYYAPTAKLIYTYDLATETWDEGLIPVRDVLYLVLDKKNVPGEYFQWMWAGSDMSPIPNSIDVGSVIHNSTTKDILIDTDEVGIIDSEDGNTIKKTTWSNLKTKLTTLFDSIYIKLSNLVTSISSSSTNSQIPSAKLLYDQLIEKPNFRKNIDFTTIELPSSNYWNRIAYGNKSWVIIASYNSAYQNALYSKDNGLTWETSTLPETVSYKDLCYGHGVFVAVGGNHNAAYSEDGGVTWNISTLPDVTVSWRNIAFGNGTFVAYSQNTLHRAYSLDYGKTWIDVTGLYTVYPYGMVFGNGMFIAISGYLSATDIYEYSDDNGETWKSGTFPESSDWMTIGFGNDRFVVASNTKVYCSFDGLTWIQGTLPSANNWSTLGGKICYGKNGFMLLGGSKTAFSQDGLSWYEVASISAGFDADYGDGQYIKTGSSTPYSYIKIISGRFFKDFYGQKINIDCKDIWFDKRTSSLEADNTQDAIDELAARKESVYLQCACSDKTTPLAVGAGVGVIPVPCSFVLTEVRAFLVTAQTSGNLFTIDVKLDGTSILSTLLTIDNGEHSSTSATTPAVISTQQIPDDSVITVDVTQIGDGTAIELIVTLKGHKL